MNRLFVPTLSGYRDMFKARVSEANTKAVLFNPEPGRFRYMDGCLYDGFYRLSLDDVFELAAQPNVNRSLDEPVLPLALFMYLYESFDLRNQSVFVVGLYSLYRWLGVSFGPKGFQLEDKLINLQHVYGVLENEGVFPLIEVDVLQEQGSLMIRAEYFHRVLNRMLEDCYSRYGDRGFYYSNSPYVTLLSERSKLAACLAIELAGLVVTSGQRGKPSISLKWLSIKTPWLYELITSPRPIGYRNRQLRKAFAKACVLLDECTSLPTKYPRLTVDLPHLHVEKGLDRVISIHRGK